LCAKQINVLVAFGLPVMPVTSLTICLLPVFHRGSIIHGTTFRALKVTSQVATTGAESAVCDWFCGCAQPLRRRVIHRQIDPRDATAVSSSTFRNAETMTRYAGGLHGKLVERRETMTWLMTARGDECAQLRLSPSSAGR